MNRIGRSASCLPPHRSRGCRQKEKRHVKSTCANSTPATDGKHVVAFFESQGVCCFDMTGRLLP